MPPRLDSHIFHISGCPDMHCPRHISPGRHAGQLRIRMCSFEHGGVVPICLHCLLFLCVWESEKCLRTGGVSSAFPAGLPSAAPSLGIPASIGGGSGFGCVVAAAAACRWQPLVGEEEGGSAPVMSLGRRRPVSGSFGGEAFLQGEFRRSSAA